MQGHHERHQCKNFNCGRRSEFLCSLMRITSGINCLLKSFQCRLGFRSARYTPRRHIPQPHTTQRHVLFVFIGYLASMCAQTVPICVVRARVDVTPLVSSKKRANKIKMWLVVWTTAGMHMYPLSKGSISSTSGGSLCVLTSAQL